MLKSTEHHYTDSTRSPSVCSETVPVRDTRGHITAWKHGQFYQYLGIVLQLDLTRSACCVILDIMSN